MARIGIIASSGGSAFDAAQGLLAAFGRRDFSGIVVDRACGFQSVAKEHGLPCTLMPYEDPVDFSMRALRVLQDGGADACLLFFTRRVAAPLIGSMPVWNLHPSLLPAFQGFGSARQAVAAGVRICGATLHVAEDRLDSGPILAQVSSPLPVGAREELVLHAGYLHTVYLTLLAAELARAGLVGTQSAPAGLPMSPSACPAIPDRSLAAAFGGWASRNCPGVIFHG